MDHLLLQHILWVKKSHLKHVSSLPSWILDSSSIKVGFPEGGNEMTQGYHPSTHADTMLQHPQNLYIFDWMDQFWEGCTFPLPLFSCTIFIPNKTNPHPSLVRSQQNSSADGKGKGEWEKGRLSILQKGSPPAKPQLKPAFVVYLHATVITK